MCSERARLSDIAWANRKRQQLLYPLQMNNVAQRAIFSVAVAVVANTPARADPDVQALAAATAVVALAEILGDAPGRPQPDYLAIEGGGFDVVKHTNPAAQFGLEYRCGTFVLWKLRPFVGAGGTTDESLYGYGGVRLDTYWGSRIVVTPSFAIGVYSRGSGKDLGSPPILGRFAIDLGYSFASGARIGLVFAHMSNGKVLGQESNPGTELAGLTFAFPLP